MLFSTGGKFYRSHSLYVIDLTVVQPTHQRFRAHIRPWRFCHPNFHRHSPEDDVRRTSTQFPNHLHIITSEDLRTHRFNLPLPSKGAGVIGQVKNFQEGNIAHHNASFKFYTCLHIFVSWIYCLMKMHLLYRFYYNIQIFLSI